MIKFSKFCFFLSVSLSPLSLIFSAFFFVLGINHHPDKTEDKDKIELFKKAKEQYKLQKTAFQTLGTLNIMGNDYADRDIYDRKGEELRSKFAAVF